MANTNAQVEAEKWIREIKLPELYHQHFKQRSLLLKSKGEFKKEITKLIGKERGVYALYKKDKLYCVGLATNLRTRVKQHLKDRHRQKWDKFSLFLIKWSSLAEHNDPLAS